MFRGINTLNIDNKGRLAVPTRYRETLRNQCDSLVVITLTYGERCLSLYPLPEWEEIERKVIALPSLDQTSQQLKRLFVGHATECELDKSGRMLVPNELREYAYLEKQAVMVGQGNKFEIWDNAFWNSRREQWLTPSDENGPMPLELEQLSL